MTNQDIAQKLRNQATELAHSGNNLYRVRAFRQAAVVVMGLPDDVSALVANGGPKALERVPGIGKSLATSIAALVGARGTETTQVTALAS